ncbi:N-formylmaleamate deformylase [Bacillus niacini]|uniref:N-formylmaleamate deformylase n=1 Tax=Neobacillus niacini TaxID=86668 RepID=A0A852TBZ8_9BACI|nr:alpha/beta hydrolase [Neobacillus niacini]NYE06313.1 N-formylmaleamate deformylase [Neobacillus niacini]
MKQNHSFGDLFVNGLNAKIHLITKGDKAGTPVIFLPGITSYSLSFAKVLNLMPENYYSLSMDARGRGLSDRPKEGYLLKDYTEDLLNIVNALIDNPIAPVLVGHSMGARIAAAFGSQYPSLISGIVLIDPPINGPGQREIYPNPLSMFLKQKEAVDQGDMELFRSFFPSFTEEQIAERAEEYRNNSLPAIIESYQSLLLEPFQVYIKMLSVPASLLAAEHGDTIRENELQVLKTINTSMQVERVKGVSHMVYKDAPEQTVDYIVSFIEGITKK